MYKSIKPLNNKQIGVLGLKSVVLEIADSCRRINYFQMLSMEILEYGNCQRKFFQRFFDGFLRAFESFLRIL
jgi:hypothetical protein